MSREAARSGAEGVGGCHRVFGFLDGTLCRHSPLNFSMDKSRSWGSRICDSSESFLEVFDDLAKLKMIPPVPKVKVSFN